MTYLSGDAVNLMDTKSDKEIVDLCMATLRGIFENQLEDELSASSDESACHEKLNNGHNKDSICVPEPIDWIVTHWKNNPHLHMSYSYIKEGGSGQDYDEMANSVADKLFFAGEVRTLNFN